jgi:hypothetical protein
MMSCLPNVIRLIKPRNMRLAGHVAYMGEFVHNILIRNLEVNIPSGSPRHRWEDTIKMDLKEIAWGCLGRVHLA